MDDGRRTGRSRAGHLAEGPEGIGGRDFGVRQPATAVRPAGNVPEGELEPAGPERGTERVLSGGLAGSGGGICPMAHRPAQGAAAGVSPAETYQRRDVPRKGAGTGRETGGEGDGGTGVRPDAAGTDRHDGSSPAAEALGVCRPDCVGPKPGAHRHCGGMDGHPALQPDGGGKRGEPGHRTERTAAAAGVRETVEGTPHHPAFHRPGSHGGGFYLRGTEGFLQGGIAVLHSEGGTDAGGVPSGLLDGAFRLAGGTAEGVRHGHRGDAALGHPGGFGTGHKLDSGGHGTGGAE